MYKHTIHSTVIIFQPKRKILTTGDRILKISIFSNFGLTKVKFFLCEYFVYILLPVSFQRFFLNFIFSSIHSIYFMTRVINVQAISIQAYDLNLRFKNKKFDLIQKRLDLQSRN